jgi:hypothetical protein
MGTVKVKVHLKVLSGLREVDADPAVPKGSSNHSLSSPVTRINTPASAGWGRARKIKSCTDVSAECAVGEEERDEEGLGVPPGALRVEEGVGELEEEGRFVMESLG